MKQEQMMKYQGVNLYVKNLDDDADDDKVRGIFEPFGTITSCRVMKDPKGNSKGFGFVCYNNPEEATKAVTEMNGKIVGTKPLYVALAQRKDVRRAQLEAQFSARTKILAGPGARMPGPYVQPNGPAIFYPPGAQPGFVYGGMVARGGRFAPPYGGVPANYVMVGGRGGQLKNGRGMGVPVQQRRGVKPGQHIPQPMPGAMPGMVPPEPQAQKLTPQILATFSPEDQKAVLGERIYPFILKTQPQLAGKITGMILDSLTTDEILQLIDAPDSLNEKVNEAIKVLADHNAKQKDEI